MDVWAAEPTGDDELDAELVGMVLIGPEGGPYETLTPAEAFDLADRLTGAATLAHASRIQRSWHRLSEIQPEG